MVLFSYTARDPNGTLLRGTLDAPTIDTARMALRSMQLQEEEMYQISYGGASSPLESPPGHPLPPVTAFDQQYTPVPAPVVGVPHGQPLPAITEEAIAATQKATIKSAKRDRSKAEPAAYFPLHQTLRLYAGWLLAWYGLVYAVGGYYITRVPSFEIPYLRGIFESSLVLTLTLVAFLFLLETTMYDHLIKTNDDLPRWTSPALFVGGILIFILYRANV